MPAPLAILGLAASGALTALELPGIGDELGLWDLGGRDKRQRRIQNLAGSEAAIDQMLLNADLDKQVEISNRLDQLLDGPPSYGDPMYDQLEQAMLLEDLTRGREAELASISRTSSRNSTLEQYALQNSLSIGNF